MRDTFDVNINKKTSEKKQTSRKTSRQSVNFRTIKSSKNNQRRFVRRFSTRPPHWVSVAQQQVCVVLATRLLRSQHFCDRDSNHRLLKEHLPLGSISQGVFIASVSYSVCNFSLYTSMNMTLSKWINPRVGRLLLHRWQRVRNASRRGTYLISALLSVSIGIVAHGHNKWTRPFHSIYLL